MSGFPVRTKQVAADIDGVHTEFVLMAYENRIVIFVTQIGRVGTVLEAKQDKAQDGTTSYSVNTLLGKRDEPLLEIAARQIVEQLSRVGEKRPLMITLGLKKHTPANLKTIVKLVLENGVW